MSFGSQVVAIVSVTNTGGVGWGGLKEKARTATRVEGVQFWPLTSDETPVTQTDVTTEVWRLIAGLDAAVLAAAGNGELVYDGSDHPELLDLDSDAGRAATFQIDGQKMPKQDFQSLHHVTIFAKRQVG